MMFADRTAKCIDSHVQAQRTPARLQPACEAPHIRSFTVPVSRLQHRKAFSRHYPRQAGTVCHASSGTLSKPRSGYLSNSFADQDIFLIAGAGIAGLAMAAALTKVGSLAEQAFVVSLCAQCQGWLMIAGWDTM